MISYRAKRFLRRLLTAAMILCVVGALLLLFWLLWLNRYVIYTREGAKLDFDLSSQYAQGEPPVAPTAGETVQITVENPRDEEDTGPKEFTRFSGYYVDLDTLLADFEGTQQTLAALPAETAVMLDVKSVKSMFYYTTNLGNQAEDFDSSRLDALIETLQNKGHYLIARVPAFQEYYYILENERERVPYGLEKSGGNGSLWLDTGYGCYWLDPASDGTLTYLIQIVTELRNKGFDEVVFADFRYPDTDQIVCDDDKLAVLNSTAATLVKTCATDAFAVSFTRSAADLTLPEGRTRLYITGITAADAAAIAESTAFQDPTAHIVFLTDLSDTRFDEYSVLRPLSTAH